MLVFSPYLSSSAEVKNAVPRVEGSRMRIDYDLEGEKEIEGVLTVTVGGVAKSAKELHFEGDIGKVKPGKGKCVYWNVPQYAFKSFTERHFPDAQTHLVGPDRIPRSRRVP